MKKMAENKRLMEQIEEMEEKIFESQVTSDVQAVYLASLMEEKKGMVEYVHKREAEIESQIVRLLKLTEKAEGLMKLLDEIADERLHRGNGDWSLALYRILTAALFFYYLFCVVMFEK